MGMKEASGEGGLGGARFGLLVLIRLQLGCDESWYTRLFRYHPILAVDHSPFLALTYIQLFTLCVFILSFYRGRKKMEKTLAHAKDGLRLVTEKLRSAQAG